MAPTDGSLHFGILGPLVVTNDDEALHAGGPKQRAVLAMLLLDANRVVSVSRLANGLWSDVDPDKAPAAIQMHVSNLRRAIQPGVKDTVIRTRPPGYSITLVDDQLDLLQFQAAMSQARAAGPTDSAAALAAYERALGLWRGSALGDLLNEPFADSAAIWLEEQRILAIEGRFDVALGLGHERELVHDIEKELAGAPLSERLWRLLMIALYRSGRQADALSAYRRAREALIDELGLEPGPELRATERAILDQDSALDRVVASQLPTPGMGMTTTRAPAQGEAILELPDGGTLLLPDRAFSIGRSEDCDLALVDPAVSRRHAEIRPSLGGHLLIDNGSTNGTAVNGEPVVHCTLRDADVVQIGALSVRYRVS